MSGVLLYPQSEAARNAFAIAQFQKHLGVSLFDETYRGTADYVINRTNDFKIAQYYEARGVRVFNPSALSRLANDKQRCYDFMEAHGIPVLPTRYRGVPAVKKPAGGHGGIGVTLLCEAEPFADGYVYQQPADTLGKDLRVWAIGGEIQAAMLRVSKTDFRSNFCLGGEALPYRLNGEEEALVKRILSLVESDYIGVDFLFHQGGLVFNELEDTVGARMLYTHTTHDILAAYCAYIKNAITD